MKENLKDLREFGKFWHFNMWLLLFSIFDIHYFIIWHFRRCYFFKENKYFNEKMHNAFSII